ncbi:hypothetical protein GM661_00365 [Iocasia frigidifontis]|uniref:Uncharacterized protein n=1 Tax=Iocasia fonsfrigidae TaxID=2682810 RepID=A0A8A7KCB3_9FIRM|nr:hypothetical protein [Iocasia fonsfrigidae]QTL96527.1 hypothetical protein GM661_00365 [Iocasia fonsfrigidae]
MKENRKNTFCNDCCEDPETCGKDPLDCMKEKDAELYFRLYDGGGIGSYASTKGVVA